MDSIHDFKDFNKETVFQSLCATETESHAYSTSKRTDVVMCNASISLPCGLNSSKGEILRFWFAYAGTSSETEAFYDNLGLET